MRRQTGGRSRAEQAADDRPCVIHSDPDILGGSPVFVGTRVPFQNLIDYLSAGDSLDEFLQQFPGVKRTQAALEEARADHICADELVIAPAQIAPVGHVVSARGALQG